MNVKQVFFGIISFLRKANLESKHSSVDLGFNMSLLNLVVVFALAIGATKGYSVPTCSQISTMTSAISAALQPGGLWPAALRLGK